MEQAAGDVNQVAPDQQQQQQPPPPPQQSDAPPAATTGEGGEAAANGQPKEEEQLTKADLSLMNKYIRSSLINSTSDVEVVRNDPTSPLYSVKTFEELNLDEQLLLGLHNMNFSKPSKIQATVLPLIVTERKNVIAQSQSGTGKTAAFLLSALSRVEPHLKHPQVIILSPTYELACQTFTVATEMAKFKTDIAIKRVTKERERIPIANANWTEAVLIGTPGKMIDSAFKYKNFDLKKIKVFVLDEADVMIDTQGHKKQSLQMRRALSNDCQILFFSATYNDEIRKFATAIVPNAVEIHLKREEQSLANINQYYVYTPTEEDKYRVLVEIFVKLGIALAFIFCQTKRSAMSLKQRLNNDGHKVGLITGELTVEERNQALIDFKNGNQKILIATNLMARDLNRQIDKETYLHRIGRTGRFGKNGFAFNFICNMEEKKMMDTLQSYFKQPINELNTSVLEDMSQNDD